MLYKFTQAFSVPITDDINVTFADDTPEIITTYTNITMYTRNLSNVWKIKYYQ